MPRHELQLQKKMVARIKEVGGEARICAQTDLTTVGDPDIYGCLRGLMLQLEVKDEHQYGLQDIQRKRLIQWEAAGAWAYKVINMTQLEIIIDAILSDRHASPIARNFDFTPRPVVVRVSAKTARRKGK